MLKFWGRGSAFNVKEGNNMAYIKEDGKLFLIDCGSSAFADMLQSGFLEDVSEIHVAVTHKHPDHIGSLGDLIFYCYYKKHFLLDVYSDDPRLKNCLGLMGVLPEHYRLHRGGYIESLGVNVQFVPCSHAAVYESPDGRVSSKPIESTPNIFPCYSILIDYKGKRIFYSGDTNHVDWDRWKDADILYVDTTLSDYPGNAHYNIDRIYRDSKAADPSLPGKIWCMHINSDAIPQRAKELGFHVVDVEK